MTARRQLARRRAGSGQFAVRFGYRLTCHDVVTSVESRDDNTSQLTRHRAGRGGFHSSIVPCRDAIKFSPSHAISCSPRCGLPWRLCRRAVPYSPMHPTPAQFSNCTHGLVHTSLPPLDRASHRQLRDESSSSAASSKLYPPEKSESSLESTSLAAPATASSSVASAL